MGAGPHASSPAALFSPVSSFKKPPFLKKGGSLGAAYVWEMSFQNLEATVFQSGAVRKLKVAKGFPLAV